MLTGAKRAAVEGFEDGLFYEPTILAGAEATNFIMNEEVFGPVLASARFRDEDAGIVLYAHGSGSSRLSPRNNACVVDV